MKRVVGMVLEVPLAAGGEVVVDGDVALRPTEQSVAEVTADEPRAPDDEDTLEDGAEFTAWTPTSSSGGPGSDG